MKPRMGHLVFWLLASLLVALVLLIPQNSSAAAAPSITTQPPGQSILVESNALLKVGSTKHHQPAGHSNQPAAAKIEVGVLTCWV
jgi:hypothetical protein